jgi:hypothetical protein
MAKMKPGQISAKRAYAIADSLDKASGLAGVGSPLSSLNKKSTAADSAKAYQAGFARIESAEKNKQAANRFRSVADAAMAKANAAAGRDTPLPSSEGLFSKIKNWFD